MGIISSTGQVPSHENAATNKETGLRSFVSGGHILPMYGLSIRRVQVRLIVSPPHTRESNIISTKLMI